MAKYYFKGNSSAMLNSYLQKSIKNRLRRWDFCTPVSLSDGQRSKCADLAELLLLSAIFNVPGLTGFHKLSIIHLCVWVKALKIPDGQKRARKEETPQGDT